MENQDKQPPQDSPETTPDKQPLLSAKPREQIRMRRADAEPTFERTSDKGDAVTPIRLVKPSGSGINLLGLIVPIGVTFAIIAGGYFGYRHVKEQSDRMSAAERAALDADSTLEQGKRHLADAKTEVRDTKSRIPAEIEKSKREAADKANSEFGEELATLSRNITATDFAGKDAGRKAEGEMQRKLTDLKNRADELLNKADALETKNRELKAWLNAHTLTMHPKF